VIEFHERGKPPVSVDHVAHCGCCARAPPCWPQAAVRFRL
jgi:hypothetical protein